MSYRLRNASATERFWFAVVKRENGCWLYRNRPEVYGTLKGEDGKNKLAHRFSYELHHGEIGRGMFICHRCDTPGCVNPEHLYAGTHEDNTQDMVDRDRYRTPKHMAYKESLKVTDPLAREQIKIDYATGMFTMVALAKKYNCSQSTISCTIRDAHNTGSGKTAKRRTGNFRSKISEDQRQEIREKYASGAFTQTQLAVEYGVTQTRVSDIITGRDLKRAKTIPINHSEFAT